MADSSPDLLLLVSRIDAEVAMTRANAGRAILLGKSLLLPARRRAWL